MVFAMLVAIILGMGMPTTAAYAVAAAVIAPGLIRMGIPPLTAHFFIFYYAVISAITPPVALAAYAASGIAGANAFRAGNTAFRLSMGKVMVPFVFVFSPSILIVTQDFTWQAFTLAVTGLLIGIWMLSAAISGWLFAPLWRVERIVLSVSAILLVVPSLTVTVIGLALSAPIFLRQLAVARRPTG